MSKTSKAISIVLIIINYYIYYTNPTFTSVHAIFLYVSIATIFAFLLLNRKDVYEPDIFLNTKLSLTNKDISIFNQVVNMTWIKQMRDLKVQTAFKKRYMRKTYRKK